MPSKPESNFIDRIHRKLNKAVYKQAMGLTATNGTPDYYYEGITGHLWVEYKWYPEKPDFIDLCDTGKKPNLSKLQQHWLRRANNSGQPIAVVAGFPGGVIVLVEDEFEAAMPMHDAEQLHHMVLTEQDWVECLNELNI